jgi:hypothetical protein
VEGDEGGKSEDAHTEGTKGQEYKKAERHEDAVRDADSAEFPRAGAGVRDGCRSRCDKAAAGHSSRDSATHRVLRVCLECIQGKLIVSARSDRTP